MYLIWTNASNPYGCITQYSVKFTYINFNCACFLIFINNLLELKDLKKCFNILETFIATFYETSDYIRKYNYEWYRAIINWQKIGDTIVCDDDILTKWPIIIYYRLYNQLKLINELSTMLVILFSIYNVYAISKVNNRTYRYSKLTERHLWYRNFAIHFDRTPWLHILCANIFAIDIYHQPILEGSNINFVPILIEYLFQNICQFCIKKNIKFTITIYVNLQSNLI